MDQHSDAWHIPTEDGTDYGVLVKCGPPHRPYYWLLCPATATLYLGPPFELRDCCDGPSCNFVDDVHAEAHRLVEELSSKETPAAAYVDTLTQRPVDTEGNFMDVQP